MTITKNRQSDSYLGTFDVQSVTDMQQLSDLRQMVTNLNKMLKTKTGKTFRVVVRGRKPAVKMVVPRSFYTPASNRAVGYTYGGNIVGGLANATKFDAYLYERR